MADKRNDVGQITKQRRIVKGLVRRELAAMSGVSTSHLGRIERGERSPSAQMVRKLAKPLGFSETELFTLANSLSPQSPVPNEAIKHSVRQLDAYVSGILSQEPVEVQRTVIGILSILKSIAKTVKAEEKSISNKS